jgi:hypothetical protein
MVDGRLAASPQIFSPPNPIPTYQAASRKLPTTMIGHCATSAPQKQIGTSLFDAFVSRIANQDGLRSMQKSALTKGHPRKCQSVRSTLTAYGVRMNPCTAPAEST